ncbi:alpha/beta fold hydrolase [Streptomyces scopuliridis]|uniref:Alpha/beta fold hydrolase n=1 Tax=Streptomyces scopuliridis TaxID=452529 RepID=A0ACD4ZCC0_9ACTN|nr:alpha/beta fold hydrolase [Streptomyces scopuliridis]WSB31701.1 alpha/beta fold hydrolase [Streptomyces scopuliridis]WSB95948.1 alpha/beta fold hydrolase [Streptomyces scopuliridis]WSC10345.1 alpha/beta fold hydrolase [Streptomyces scopuliridis]
MNRPADVSPLKWLRWYRKAAEPRLRLVCFPHAGGAASVFRDWPRWLPEDIEVIGVCYPGRQDRVMEPCVDEMGALTTRIADALQGYAGGRLAFFGHSMGASVAYEVALRLQQRTGSPLAWLFVSGQLPSHRVVPKNVYRRGDDAIVDEVRRLGDPDAGTVLDDPDLRELVLPAIRADFHLIGTYLPRPVSPLATPVTAYVGDGDEEVPVEGLREWAAATATGRFDHRVYPGGHFYLLEDPEALVRDLAGHLTTASVAG